MELYEVESIRWYYSAVFYRVIADSKDNAIQHASDGELRDNVLETSISGPTWNGKEEYLEATIIETVHEIHSTDILDIKHTNCKYIGNNLWDCSHIDLIDMLSIYQDDESKWIQLPLIDGYETSSNKPQSWIMWFEKWADSLNEDAYAEAWEQYEASGGKW
jgi:hypothetical protein